MDVSATPNDASRPRPDDRTADMLKALFALVAPPAAALEICRLFRWDIAGLKRIPSYYIIQFLFPPMSEPGYGTFRLILAGTGCLALTIYFCPMNRRKHLLAAGTLAYMLCFLKIRFLAHYLLGVTMAWWTIRSCRGTWTSGIGMIASLAMMTPPLLLENNSLGRFLTGSLYCMSALRFYSVHKDTETSRKDVGFLDHLLFMTGGFPCNFWGPWYRYGDFTRSFLPKPYDLMIWDAAARIHAGIGKLALCAAFDLWAMPGLRGWIARAGDAAPNYYPWACVFILTLLRFLRVMGSVQILQGLNTLSGYQVQDQFNKPWLSSSPLDFWRRYAAVNRAYLMKYVFYPIGRGGHPYVAVCITFAVSVSVSQIRNMLHLYGSRPILEECLAWVVYMALFAATCSLALLCREKGWATGAGWGASPRGRLGLAAMIAATWALLILIQVPVPEVFNVVHGGTMNPPGEAAGSMGRLATQLHRYLSLYATMLFLNETSS